MRNLLLFFMILFMAACSTDSPAEREHNGREHGTTDIPSLPDGSRPTDEDMAELLDSVARFSCGDITLRVGEPGVLYTVRNDNSQVTLRDLNPNGNNATFHTGTRRIELNNKLIAYDALLLGADEDNGIKWWKAKTETDSITVYFVTTTID